MSSEDSGSSQNYGTRSARSTRMGVCPPAVHAACITQHWAHTVGATYRGPVAVVSGDVSLLGQPKDALFEDELGVAGTHFGKSE